MDDAVQNEQRNGGCAVRLLLVMLTETAEFWSTDWHEIEADQGQPVTSANFRDDINLSGVVNKPDLKEVDVKKSHRLP